MQFLSKPFNTFLDKQISIAPLVVFRIAFGTLLFFSTIRFWALGWIEEHYINSVFHFRYFGFEWVPVGPDWMIYLAHVIMIISSIGILLGAYYRLSALSFFLSFTYTELIDVSYYLNHYYFVSLIAFWMVFLPANKYFSVDVYRRRFSEYDTTPAWTIRILQFQLFVVYFFAGIAKINSDWLFEAMPLRIWLPAHDTLPLIGNLLTYPETAFVFSWFGMIYDISIVFFLIWKRTRLVAYLTVIVFHSVTGILFQIGVFPLVMIASAVIFFDEKVHQKWISSFNAFIKRLTGKTILFDWENMKVSCLRPLQARERFQAFPNSLTSKRVSIPVETHYFRNGFLLVYVVFQLVFPFRYLFYPGNMFWTEQGYRFGWRVMLVEKSGSATFFVKDSKTGKEGIVDNAEFLNRHQEKQMAFQPDMILQFAHFLADVYEERGVYKPEIRAEIYVTLNGRPSELLVDSTLILNAVYDSWESKNWILPFSK